MKPAIKRKWVAALRSDKYKQGQGKLRSMENEFCCLGVLCDLCAKETGKRIWGRVDGRRGGDYYVKTKHQAWDDLLATGKCGTVSYPPPEVVEWAGLPSHNPIIKGTALSLMNDSGDSFLKIADRIEKSL